MFRYNVLLLIIGVPQKQQMTVRDFKYVVVSEYGC